MMELNELVGLHELTGVDFNTESVESYGVFEDCNTINFVLDGKTYTAVEDPEDGYRSAMGEIKVSDFKVSNLFAPIRVFASMRVTKYDDSDILDFHDLKNGKVVLSVGTDYSDSYYPSYVADFTPENMHVNEGKS